MSAGIFGRGETYHGTTETISSTYGESVILEGQIKIFRDTDPTDRKKPRSQRDVKAICVRNTSGFTIYAGRLMLWEADYRGKRVAGYTNTLNCEVAGVVDDHVGSGGVRDNDLFWLIVEGPCTALLSSVAADAVIVAGNQLVAVTGATSGGTASGRFTQALGTCTVTAATDGGQFDKICNRFGRAISAATTADTAITRLVDVRLGV